MISSYDERSAGFIVYKENGERKYLMLLHGSDYWNFPKGKLESGETEIDAAIRELEEETAIKNISIKSGFDSNYTYTYKNRGKKIKKLVTMYLAYYLEDEVVISHEHQKYKWMLLSEALNYLKFENLKKILNDADLFLIQAQ